VAATDRRLTTVLPGVYAPAEDADRAVTRMAALARWAPDAVLTDEAAASLTFWPKLEVPTVRCHLQHRRRPQPGYAFARGLIPMELVTDRHGLRMTTPASWPST